MVMAEGKPQQEPSMEEILASIRRIISEDGTEQDAGPAAEAAPPAPEPPAPEPPPAPAPEPEPDPIPPAPEPVLEPEEEEVLELTERVDTPQPDPDPEPDPVPVPAPPPFVGEDDGLLSPDADAAARQALHRLDGYDTPMVPYRAGEGDGGKTLEQLVAELLQPMLRDWLNANLPGMVERIVEREVRRLGRGR